MKIEKLTEDKIRVIINADEENMDYTDLHTIMSKAGKSQGLFFNILQKAEKEVNFHTDGCKLLIEAFTFFDDILIFTITKYSMNTARNSLPEVKRKVPTVKRKTSTQIDNNMIYCFDDFNTFCKFCQFLKVFHNLNIGKITNSDSLYCLHDTYYLVLKNINIHYDNINLFFCALSEFGKVFHYSDSFECKLLEYGKVIIKKDAISIGMQCF